MEIKIETTVTVGDKTKVWALGLDSKYFTEKGINALVKSSFHPAVQEDVLEFLNESVSSS